MRFPNDLEERFMKEQSSRIAWALSIQSVVASSASLIGCCLLFIITRNPVANTDTVGTDTETYFYDIYEGSIRVGLMAGGLSCMAFAASLAEIHYPLSVPIEAVTTAFQTVYCCMLPFCYPYYHGRALGFTLDEIDASIGWRNSDTILLLGLDACMTAIFLLTPTRASVNFVIPIGVLTEYMALIAYYGSSHRDIRCGATEARTDAAQAQTNGPAANFIRYEPVFMDIWNTVVFMVLCFFSWTGRYGIERSTREKFVELQTSREENLEQDKRITQLQTLLSLTTTFVVEVDRGFIVPSDEFCEVFGHHCALRTVRLRDLCATRESQQRVDAFLAAVRNERTPQKATLTLLGGEKREIVYCHVFGLSETCEGSDQLSITFGFQVLEFHHTRRSRRRIPGDARFNSVFKHRMSADDRSALQKESALPFPEVSTDEEESTSGPARRAARETSRRKVLTL
jgi:hypothetical protein